MEHAEAIEILRTANLDEMAPLYGYRNIVKSINRRKIERLHEAAIVAGGNVTTIRSRNYGAHYFSVQFDVDTIIAIEGEPEDELGGRDE